MITISEYLLKRLLELGIKHIFGVPGDYNLAFLDKITACKDLEWVGTCNELNGAYAADGYARIKGASALVTTFGVGELSAINGIAGAYAEFVPIVNIVGIPATDVMERKAIMHHTLGDGRYTVYYDMYKNVTRAHTIISKENAAVEIDRLLLECWRTKRPVYIGLPSNLVDEKIHEPQRPLDLKYPPSNMSAVKECVEQIASIIEQAKSPVILADLCADRHPMKEGVEKLLTLTHIPYANMNMAKGLIDESHPQHLGNYCGAFSTEGVRELVENSDCVITFGSMFSDFNTGGFSAKLDANTSIEIHSNYTRVRQAIYPDVFFNEVIPALLERLKSFRYQNKFNKPKASPQKYNGDKLTQDTFWHHVSDCLAEDGIVIAETGTSLFGALQMSLPNDTKFIGQTLYGSIGYSVGALLGAKIAAPEKQVVLFVGDGSFQLTAQEVSTMMRHNLNPIIFLLNNDGYTIERLIRGADKEYNNIAKWNYEEFPKIFNGKVHSIKVQNREELDNLVKKIKQGELNKDGLLFIEVMLAKMDAPEVLVNLGKAMDEANVGHKRP